MRSPFSADVAALALLVGSAASSVSAASASTSSNLRARATEITSAPDLANCDCGIIDSADPAQNIWSQYLFLNFRQMTSIPPAWRLKTGNVTRQSGTALTRAFMPDLVGLAQSGLQLEVEPFGDGSVGCSGLQSFDKAYGFGSYHMTAQVDPQLSSVSALFVYKNDTSEVDIEYAPGSQVGVPTASILRYSVKPQIYNNGVPSGLTYQTQNVDPQAMSTAMHEWGFIWTSQSVQFGMDEVYGHEMTTNVPQEPGNLIVSHWADGDLRYSGPLPQHNSTLQVGALWGYYNTTSADSLACKKTQTVCLARVSADSANPKQPKAKSAASPQQRAAVGSIALLSTVAAAALLL